MPKRQSLYQTHGVGYGSYNPNYVQRHGYNQQQGQWSQGGFYNQGYNQPGYVQSSSQQQPLNSAVYYQPTGISSGLNLAPRNRSRSSSSSSRSSGQSPSRLEAWRRNHEQKKQQKMRSRMPMQTQYPMQGQPMTTTYPMRGQPMNYSNVQQVHSEGFHDSIQSAMGRWQ